MPTIIPTKEFTERFRNTELYDLPVLCLQEIKIEYRKSGATFISRFIDPIHSGNSRVTEYKKFWDSLKKAIQDCRENGHDDVEDIKTCIVDIITDFDVPPGSDLEHVRSVLMFIVIVELDKYIGMTQKHLIDNKTRESCAKGPLNKNIKKDQYALYVRAEESFVEKANSNTKNGFRRILTTRPIGDRFDTLQIIEKSKLPTEIIPTIRRVYLGEKTEKAAKTLKKARIAVIPYVSFATCSFHEISKKDAIEPGKLPQGPFYIEYSNEKEWFADQVVELLDRAIKNLSNIVVFPEFIMSPSILKTIAKKLESLYYREPEETSLWAVFAGSTYDYDKKAETGNNILHILDNRGEEIAKYYKYHPFHKDDMSEITESKDSEAKKKDYIGVESIEILSDRGKEVCLIDVPKIGRILPGICKDAIESDYTISLSKIFHPSMQLIPAWSTSVSSFDYELVTLANKDHVTSIVCNCCNAVKNKETEEDLEIGKVYLPKMENGKMNTKLIEYRRTDECFRTCKEGEEKKLKAGCIHYFDFDIGLLKPDCTHDIDIAKGELPKPRLEPKRL